MFPDHPTLEMQIYCLEDAIMLSDPVMDGLYDRAANDLLIYAGGDLYDPKKFFNENLSYIAHNINLSCVAAIRTIAAGFN